MLEQENKYQIDMHIDLLVKTQQKTRSRRKIVRDMTEYESVHNNKWRN